MIISKSLYKEYCQFPKLARWHLNDKKVYQSIQEDQYGNMDGANIGDEVEGIVKELFHGKTIINVSIEGFSDYHSRYHTTSSELLKKEADIYSQAGFLFGNLYSRTDFLVKNEQGTYDIVEVKSITSPLTTTKIPTLKPELLSDVSFQHYVIKNTLGKKYSGNVYIYYLNKEFRKHGDIKPEDIISIINVTEYLESDENIKQVINAIEKTLILDEKAFSQYHPFEGAQYFFYHGEKPENGTIYTIPRITSSKKKLAQLLALGKTNISDMTEEDILTLGDENGEENNFQKFIRLYQAGYVVDKDTIRSILSGLVFPFYFYDYETICTPIPILEDSGPWQQVVVQYSLHKMDADGTISHSEGILKAGENMNKRIIDKLVADIGNPQGTFIVWNKAFENSRNTEIGLQYPEYKDFFERVNAQTFDLMEIFRNLHYFHRDFHGSSSIKKVLPILTDITYDGLAVPHGGVAMDTLQKIATGQLVGPESEQMTAYLLEYCQQDTRAMVAIYQRLLKDIA